MQTKFTYQELEQRVKNLEKESVDGKHAEEMRKRRAAQLEMIHEIGRRVSQELDLDTLFSKTVKYVQDAFGFDSVMLLLDEEAGKLNLQSIVGDYSHIFTHEMSLPIGKGMIGYAAATAKIQVSGNVNNHPHFFRQGDEKTNSELSVPIKSGGRVIAVLDLQSDQYDAFDQIDVMVMETLADYIAISIENARLYKTVQQELIERKKAEKALLESEEQYRDIFNSAGDCLFVIDLQGKIKAANDTACQTYGYNQEELIDQFATRLITSRYHKIFKSFIRYTKMKGSSLGEAIAVRKDGSTFDTEVRGSIIRIKGAPHLLTIIRDVSARKRAEKALHREKEKFRVLVEQSPLGISIINRDGIFQYVNSKFVEIFGYTLKDIPTGRIWFKKAFPDPKYRQKVIKAWIKDKKKSKAGEARSRYFQVTAKDKSIKLIHFRSVTMASENQFIIYEDITNRKRLEAKLQQAQKMEAVGTLAGGIAHDFNNLLMAIQGRISLMLIKEDSSTSNHRHLKGIEDYIKSASGLTKQLLGFARGGKYEVKPSDLNKLVNKSSEMFGRTKKEITIHRNYCENIWTVHVDRSQIEQVCLNLFVNAWQAMSGNGRLYLQTENVTLTEAYTKPYSVKAGKFVKLSVTDTGIGMDEETQLKIFDPFFTTKGRGRGTGLGLASAYGIIRSHSGIINVYSSPGEGATFNIYIPASASNFEEETKTSNEVLPGNETVLLVDDEEMILEVDREILETLGYKVFMANSGQEALEIYQEHQDKIALVILDLIMPEMSGSETFDKLRKINPHVIVLLSSGYSINGSATNILKRGCNGFIQKPFDMEQLSRKMRDLLDPK